MLVGLFYGITAGPSNAGDRKDGKPCTAQPGECRFNSRYYTPGMGDAKSWSDPCADESCPERCPYLRGEPRDMGDESERRGRAIDLVNGLAQKAAYDRMIGEVACSVMGIDLREVLGDE